MRSSLNTPCFLASQSRPYAMNEAFERFHHDTLRYCIVGLHVCTATSPC